jgi:hypothetical protein
MISFKKIMQAANRSLTQSQYKRSQRCERQSPTHKRKRLNLGWRRSHLRTRHWLTSLTARAKHGKIIKISRHRWKYGLSLRSSGTWRYVAGKSAPDVSSLQWCLSTPVTKVQWNAVISQNRNLEYTAINTSKHERQGLQWQTPCMYYNSELIYVMNVYTQRLPPDLKTCTRDKEQACTLVGKGGPNTEWH